MPKLFDFVVNCTKLSCPNCTLYSITVLGQLKFHNILIRYLSLLDYIVYTQFFISSHLVVLHMIFLKSCKTVYGSFFALLSLRSREKHVFRAPSSRRTPPANERCRHGGCHHRADPNVPKPPFIGPFENRIM